jgi:DNA-directed RNA polymerase specialized sigma24 family protein
LNVARRRLRLSVLRDEARHPHLPLDLATVADEHDQDPCKSLEENDLWLAVLLAFQGLAPAERDLLRFRYWRGESVAVVARRLGVSDACAQRRAQRALAHMRRLMGREKKSV